MPWSTKDVSSKSKKAKSATRKRQWRDVANGVLKKTGDEARAIRTANGVVKKQMAKTKR